ncbi:uncharacterized protein LOC108871751 isoform X2 [Brassica rapa]|uniref:uncharacterized protein LOC108871751 isoform X2 n=1 Tax=Brassica campestris TaxID=3711 RepID=UPI00142DA785|nr:uncharacterized protein LOC108871751 isoform X2 [Brassica rapa]
MDLRSPFSSSSLFTTLHEIFMAMEACRRKTCRRRLNLRLRAREPRRKNQGPQRQQLEPRAPIRIAITKEALGFWTVKLFRKMGCGCYCFPISEMGDACYAATCIFQVKSTMDTPLAMGAFVSARFLKFLLSTTVRNRKSFVVQSKRLVFAG